MNANLSTTDYILNFLTGSKSLLIGGQSGLENKKIMSRNEVFLFTIHNDEFHKQSVNNY